NRLAAEPVGELPLPQRPDEEPKQRDAADPRHLRLRNEAALDQVGNQGSENCEVEYVAEIARCDKRKHLPVDRAHSRVVHRLADKGVNRRRRLGSRKRLGPGRLSPRVAVCSGLRPTFRKAPTLSMKGRVSFRTATQIAREPDRGAEPLVLRYRMTASKRA